MSKDYEKLTLEQRALTGLANFIIMHGNNDDYDASAIEWHGILKTAIFELEDLRESTKECEKELEGLKHDVKRFIELLMKDNHTGRDTFDIEILKDKLMEVGKEE